MKNSIIVFLLAILLPSYISTAVDQNQKEGDTRRVREKRTLEYSNKNRKLNIDAILNDSRLKELIAVEVRRQLKNGKEGKQMDRNNNALCKNVHQRESELAFLHVPQPKQVLVGDEHLSLTCSAKGDPSMLSGKWIQERYGTTFKTTKIHTSNDVYNITVNVFQTGRYQCQIKDRRGIILSAFVDVKKVSFGSKLLTAEQSHKLYQWMGRMDMKWKGNYKTCSYYSRREYKGKYISPCQQYENVLLIIKTYSGNNMFGGVKEGNKSFLFDFQRNEIFPRLDDKWFCSTTFDRLFGPCFFGKDLHLMQKRREGFSYVKDFYSVSELGNTHASYGYQHLGQRSDVLVSGFEILSR